MGKLNIKFGSKSRMHIFLHKTRNLLKNNPQVWNIYPYGLAIESKRYLNEDWLYEQEKNTPLSYGTKFLYETASLHGDIV